MASSAAPTERHGSCLCGAVRVRLSAEPRYRLLCHCISCQKASGSFAGAMLVYHKDKVEFVDNGPVSTVRSYSDTSCDSGGVLERSFCAVCGSNLRLDAGKENLKDMIMIPLGLLDGDKKALKPGFEVFIKRKVSWFPGLDGTLKIDGDA